MNSNSNNNNVGVGGGCVIKHLNCKSTSQESTDADRKIQKKQEKIAKYSLKAERIQQKQKDLQKKIITIYFVFKYVYIFCIFIIVLINMYNNNF